MKVMVVSCRDAPASSGQTSSRTGSSRAILARIRVRLQTNKLYFSADLASQVTVPCGYFVSDSRPGSGISARCHTCTISVFSKIAAFMSRLRAITCSWRGRGDHSLFIRAGKPSYSGKMFTPLPKASSTNSLPFLSHGVILCKVYLPPIGISIALDGDKMATVSLHRTFGELSFPLRKADASLPLKPLT